MQSLSTVFSNVAVLTVLMTLLLPNAAAGQATQLVNHAAGVTATSGQALQLNVSVNAYQIHIFPTALQIETMGAQNNGGTPPLLYHGGRVMHTPWVYAIFWIPPFLQNGSTTSISST
jgi:hypothetical protein